MCGICGEFRYANDAPIAQEFVKAMTQRLQHRGPDGAGHYFDEGNKVGLGHRRLAIIDLATGEQPMSNGDGSLWIVFNGEIYNYRELRHTLEILGYHFRTASDTEVILHAYEQYGAECPRYFNGIFAFAIWDSHAHQLFLARDHFGVKPLYYSVADGVFRFASEQKALLADSTFPREIDLDALYLTLTFRYCPAPYTLLCGIRKLPPGCSLKISTGGIEQKNYAGDPPPIDRTTRPESWIAALREAYEAAVARQMVSDVPIGISLSGGVDSGTILALMSRHSTSPVYAFTVGFAERDDVNEIGAAHQLATRFGAVATTKMITEQDYATFMERYIWHMEEPVVNQSAAAYYFVAAMAREQGVKVLLNGQGPDEAFGGYPRHLAAALTDRIQSRAPTALPRMAYHFSPSGKMRQLLEAASTHDEALRLVRIYNVLPETTRRKLLSAQVRRSVAPDLPQRWLSGQLARLPEGSTLERMLAFDARNDLSEELLLSEDKMAMAASVEARVPFLDVEVMKIAEQIPGALKIGLRQQKSIHKAACEAWLPPEVVHRKKIGFTSAAGEWLRGVLGEDFRARIAAPDSFARTYLDVAEVTRLIDEHLSQQHDFQRILFLLYSLEHWYSMFICP